MNKLGFTLIEILVAISVIALVIGVALPNFLGARERGRDIKRKSELNQLKTALRLYYSDYGRYPNWNIGVYIIGCGPAGTSQCLGSGVCTTADFAAGGTDGCGTIYMKRFPRIGTSQQFFYYQAANGDDFRLKVLLENVSDADIVSSQARCSVVPATNPAGTFSYNPGDFVLCAD